MRLRDAMLNAEVNLGEKVLILFEAKCCAMKDCGRIHERSFSETPLLNSIPKTPAEEGKPISFYFEIFRNCGGIAFRPTPFMRVLYSAVARAEIGRLENAGEGDLPCGHKVSEHIRALRELISQIQYNRR